MKFSIKETREWSCELRTTDIDLIIVKQWKPILRPLSDLDLPEDNEFNTPENLQGCTFGYVTGLISEHYDVFGLIEKGLAIDINTI